MIDEHKPEGLIAMLSHLAQALDNSILKLFLLPTEQCNFRCVYCYEEFKEKAMSPDVQGALRRFLERRAPGLSRLQVEWFGGEPLLALPLILQISEHIQALQARHGFVFGGAMTTNGFFLTPQTAAELFQRGTTEFQISLDGFGATHDQTRVKADGSGTFARIWSNLLTLKESSIEFHVMLRIHVSPHNVKALPVLLEQIDLHFAGDPRFNVLFKAVENLGGPRDGTFQTLSNSAAHETIDLLKKLLPRESLVDDKRIDVCYAAEANSWVVRSNGNLAKCTVAFADPMNNVGHIRADGTLHLFQDRLRPWMQGWTDFNEDFLACPYAAMQRFPAAAVFPDPRFAILA